jgi:hypothetical protein
LAFPNSDPENYSIVVDSDGHARYDCSVKVSPDSDEREPYSFGFELSSATRARIFDLTAQAHNFSTRLDAGNKKVAFTGTKTLTYREGQRVSSAEYNYSSVPAVQQLTTIFQGLAATLEFGRRLRYYHRYQKLALDEELKNMESQARDNELAELASVQPILQEIFDDPSVINVVRARAQRLIEMGKNPVSSRR